MTTTSSMTLRDKASQKLDLAMQGLSVEFPANEARLAGMFFEDAITLEDVNEEEQRESEE